MMGRLEPPKRRAPITRILVSMRNALRIRLSARDGWVAKGELHRRVACDLRLPRNNATQTWAKAGTGVAHGSGIAGERT
jgi:hypothetical protein